ncbi:MAG: hypothetical protein NDI67_01680 [Sulfuritalea sp.]|nr:hypothetical protein [Sulfuritalea sp.]
MSIDSTCESDVHEILSRTDQEVVALARDYPLAAGFDPAELLRYLRIEPEYAFLLTTDNLLLMSYLAAIARHRHSTGWQQDRAVWRVLETVLNRQVQMLSTVTQQAR